ncbi:MAG TPA: type II toxin-antitoxin system PemK/MazF family toxin [Ktedonobacteraceae bacterium]|nr:type II toxin-antitoxin system PemK/MazF family toxin [Ktedonobacteraceae bacterium]
MSSEARHSPPGPQQSKQIETNTPQSSPPSPRRGEIWDVNWSPGRGAEQKGIRPALIIQNDRGNASLSYPLTIVASMSRTERELPLHVRIAPSEENGLSDFTDVKCEQIMTIEKSRLIRRRGSINSEELSRVDVALKLSLSLL